tara:strand:- start:161 stop:613 length:453 start_codon:yes stop_codon:yes gene_type:complete
MTIESVINFINASMAPAVLFTGVGLLLAGLQTKYSTIATVIRQLNAEKRQHKTSSENLPHSLEIVLKQIDSLMGRAKLVRNAIFCFYATIFFLVSSSIALGLSQIELLSSSTLIFGLFGVALLFLFAGLINATREALLSYRIVQLETSQQ